MTSRPRTGSRELKDLRAGKAGAVAQAIDSHAGFLLRAAIGFGFRLAEAEDLVQDAFAVFLKAVGRFEGRSSLRTFLYGILYRKAQERWRKRGREIAVDPVDELFDGRFGRMGMWQTPPKGPGEEALTAETGRLIEDCRNALNPAQRSAFYLKEVSGESPESICNILGVKSTHLRVLLFRARNNLRECLEKKWESRG